MQASVVVNDVCSGLCYDGNLLIGTKCLWNLFTKLFTNDLAAHDAATARFFARGEKRMIDALPRNKGALTLR